MNPEFPIPETLRPTLEFRHWPKRETASPPWNKANFIGVASHPAGAKVLLTLLNAIEPSGPTMAFISAKAATKEADRFSFSHPPEITASAKPSDLWLPDFHNVILFSGTYGEEDMALELMMITAALEQKRRGTHTSIVGVEDDAQGLKPIMTMMKEKDLNPAMTVDRILLSTRSSAETYKPLGFTKPQLIPTGQPAYDAIKAENTPEINLQVRSELGIGNSDIVIAYYAARSQQFDQAEVRSTVIVCQALNRFAKVNPDKKIVFVYRMHPAEEQPGLLLSCLPESTPVLRVIGPEGTTNIDTYPLSAAADLNMSNISTTLSPVALRGSRTGTYYETTGRMPLYFIFPPAQAILDKLGYNWPVPARLGAATVSTGENGLLETINRALFDNDYRRKIFAAQSGLLRDEYRFKGTATATDRARLQLRAML